ncbi:cofilin [Histoplasma capsulatum var. duboisii H88]|nr:cofilin [Histoplasma capsulatum]QSS50251.1 cofilin [Histoplasma capsulatum var. duboisii H88]QSS73988.1 cofilin [Histoplasma capsulatum G186AR]
MSVCRVRVSAECMEATNNLRFKDLKYIIFKISDDKKEIVVEESSKDTDYETFRTKLVEAKDSNGKPAPRYALYDGEFDLGSEGIRKKIIFISWVPSETPTFSSMIYATTRETLKNALNPHVSIHADDTDELEWKTLKEASVKK